MKREIYARLMGWGHRCGCHQRPDRSFFWHGYQFPLCARCTGALCGYLLAIPLYFLLGFSIRFSYLCVLIMAADGFLQLFGLRESTNPRRLITGILGGYGILSFQLAVFCALARKLLA